MITEGVNGQGGEQSFRVEIEICVREGGMFMTHMSVPPTVPGIASWISESEQAGCARSRRVPCSRMADGRSVASSAHSQVPHS